MRSFLVLASVVALGLGGCASRPAPPANPESYSGVWSRESDMGPSSLAIRVEGTTAWFRWSLGAEDAAHSVRCEWSGACEEWQGTEKIGEYRFRSWIDPLTRRLMVEVWRNVMLPEPGREYWIDELLLHAGGDRLIARTVERDGVVFDATTQPSYEFVRVAAGVDDPPPDLPRGTGADFAPSRS